MAAHLNGGGTSLELASPEPASPEPASPEPASGGNRSKQPAPCMPIGLAATGYPPGDGEGSGLAVGCGLTTGLGSGDGLGCAVTTQRGPQSAQSVPSSHTLNS